ncbi:MAG TPA: hypothetical protein VKB63_08640, partial [Gemmatimonadales bacterium]|nr:hypothetical protein [Gemmatimonadales bacterium]
MSTPAVEREALLAELAAAEAELIERQARRLRLAQLRPQRFAEYVIKDERVNSLIQLHAMHKLWFEFILACWKRGLTPFILAPFGSGKTTLVLALILWMLGRDRNLRVKIVSASDDLAIDRARLLQSYIESSDELHQLFPVLRPDVKKGWQVKRMFVQRTSKSKDASIQALGATSSAQGSRTDLLVIDDINDLRNTIIYPRLRKQVIRNFSFLLSRVEPEVGRTVVIMTRWHVEDIFGWVTSDAIMCQQYGFLIQAIADDLQSLECEIVLGTGGKPRQLVPDDPIETLLQNIEEDWRVEPAPDIPACRNDIPWASDAAVHIHRRLPLWLDRLSPEILAARQAEMGDRDFARGYKQRAMSEKDLLWKEGYVAQCLDKSHTVVKACVPGDR